LTNNNSDLRAYIFLEKSFSKFDCLDKGLSIIFNLRNIKFQKKTGNTGKCLRTRSKSLIISKNRFKN
jgi:hypothetical protein